MTKTSIQEQSFQIADVKQPKAAPLSITMGDFRADLENPLDISVAVRFTGPQMTAFGAPPARKEVYRAGSFVGDVRQGGSCNCEVYTFSPHLNGTHTECVGHIAEERISICDVMKESLIPATLVTLEPELAGQSKDTYNPALRPDDRLITRAVLREALSRQDAAFFGALVIRTLPNQADKPVCNYDQNPPPFFSIEAMQDICSFGTRHLLVDFPSVDRPDDDGRLTNHHIFWDVAQGSHQVRKASPKTITELIFVPDSIADGRYLLNLQVAAFEGDAAPSRPVLYKVIA